MEKEKKYFMLILISMIIWTLTGCSMEEPKESHIEITPADSELYVSNEFDHAKAGRIAEILSSIYDEAGDTPYGYPSMPSGNKEETNTTGRLDTIRFIVARLGENGYAAVDSENQVDMTRAEQVLDFCKAVDEKENAETTILVITELGFRKFDLKSEDGNVTITRGEYQFDSDGQLQNISTVRYPADFWQYTEEGYLIFEGRYFSEAEFALTLSDALETTALRVLPLDETYRELNRTYLLPVGYEQNNLFLCNWSEDDFGDLDFYDLFDRLYPGMYSRPVPYRTDGDSGAGGVYQIPEDIFESVIRAYFNVSNETLRSKTPAACIHRPQVLKHRWFWNGAFRCSH